MSEKEIIDLLFHAGFSTADKVSDVSGRGVGLDVVKSKIEALSGEVEVKSSFGEGSTWTIRLPLTLAIIQALMVIVGDEKYAISLNAIQGIEDIEAAMKGMLDPVFEEKVIGHAEIRQIFKASGVGNIAGSYVMDGYFQRGCKVRISREGKQLFEGDLSSLKRFKDDVKEVKAGFECGLTFDGFSDIQELDMVEAYIMVEVPR